MINKYDFDFEKIKEIIEKILTEKLDSNDDDWKSHKMWLLDIIKNNSDSIKLLNDELDRVQISVNENIHDMEKDNNEKLLNLVKLITKMQVKVTLIMGVAISIFTGIVLIIAKFPIEYIFNHIKNMLG